MDTALNISGDISPYTISETDELKQRLYIALSAKKGGFIYDRELGSDIFSVDISEPDCINKIEAFARKALSDISNAEVIGVVAESNSICIGVETDSGIYDITINNA